MAGKRTNPSPRVLMERAIEVMRGSVQERRDDDHASPLVGAVILKSDGTIETAHRGEIRDGDHAEYTLLERKNRSNPLDGAVLFATLEPCAPGARSHPKLGCAERIVLARIREVWVGIEDPDPAVDRKGIKYLQDNGVDVHMFERDLQEIIRAENALFIDQATARARAAEEPKPTAVVLSGLEAIPRRAETSDFSDVALEEFRSRAGIAASVGSDAFNRELQQIGLLVESSAGLKPSGFGYILFGTSPRKIFPQAGFLGLIEYPNGTIERREFDEPIVLIPELVEQWLQDNLGKVVDREQMRRSEVTPLPMELVREGLVNALVHRDYDLDGAKCQLRVTPDTVVIQSPGAPPPPITVERLQSFSAPMLSRNPSVHYVFSRMALAEEQGLGIRSMRQFAESSGLPLPRYSWEDPYLVLTIYRTGASARATLSAEARAALNEAEQRGWEWLATQPYAASTQYATAMQTDERTARRHLNHFVELGLVSKTGSARATRYVINRT